MDNQRRSAWLYIAAGGCFALSGFLGGKIVYLLFSAVFLLLGLRKLKETKE